MSRPWEQKSGPTRADSLVRANIYHRRGLCAGVARSTQQLQAECNVRTSGSNSPGPEGISRAVNRGPGETNHRSRSRSHSQAGRRLLRPSASLTAFPYTPPSEALLRTYGRWEATKKGGSGGTTQADTGPAAANTYTHTHTRTHTSTQETVITRSADGVTRHTQHRVQGRQAAHVFDIGLRHNTHTHAHNLGTQPPRLPAPDHIARPPTLPLTPGRFVQQ